MYNNSYLNAFNPQVARDRIDSQIAQLQEMKNHISQPMQPSINQTFQLAPTPSGMRFAKSIEDVNKELVSFDTPFFSADLSVLWLKNAKGDVRAYELKEIVRKDEKDLIIESLQAQIKEMKEMIENAKPIITNDDESNQGEESSSISNSKSGKKKQ